ncbi:hypothetical protein LSH36_57g04092 [Paralvinella palmiformis]|uniref:Polypeptide N-acetylgalactosaminyltransferase n=1 Tax=Paralvinella palmiformis TaxID=53620 RepID=A0AAD9K530_9ANNE|nr:hypothetical protein LSH36_57g04092 [Paralvinella palmiformis]
MKRNTLRLLKYLTYVLVFVIVGPGLLRFLFGDNSQAIDPIKIHQAHGLPESPEEMKRDVEGTPGISNSREGGKYAARIPTVIVPHRLGVDDFDRLAKAGSQLQFHVGGTQLYPTKLWHIGMDMSNVLKRDWHDYELIAKDAQRTGPGEQGTAMTLSASDEEEKNKLYKVNGFNAYASDKISLDRALRDIRHPDCKKKKYLEILPNASVVIPFHNEHWTTLLRSAHSLLNRSPPHLLHEVILVDDFSSKEFLKKQLDDHVAVNYGGKVKVVHADKREGLIRTRLLGAKVATGQVIIFLDSHVEANVNWLPPLLEPIAYDYRTVVCPFIDVIDYESFEYRAQDEGARGAFDWEFFYKRLPLLPEDLQHPAEPFKSPVMAGGLFAISSKWFWELGGYDPGLDIWGGEQYELSFKLWQCGGQMVDAPCSRVGHIYRKFAPFPNPGIGDFVGKNYRRVAEVWMDEYAEYLYQRRPHYKTIDPGDLTDQKAIRIKLNCKPFKWFMTEVAFDLPKHYPPVEPPSVATGELRNVAANICVDTKYNGQNQNVGLATCISDDSKHGTEQCKISNKEDYIFLQKTKQMFHPISHQCLDCDSQRREVYMNPCDQNSLTQKWQWEHINMTIAEKEWNS